MIQSDCERIHEASLDVLATVGVRVDKPDVLRRLAEAGARTDAQRGVAYLPIKLVEWALAQAPSSARFADRRGFVAEVGPGAGHIAWTGNALYVTRGRERKLLESPDLIELTRVADACEHIDGMVCPCVSDYPPPARDFTAARLVLEHTAKHVRPCLFTPRGARLIIEMAEVLNDGASLGERPIVSFGYSIVSPLHWGEAALNMIEATSGRNIPFMLNSEPLGGGTAPVTLAGCLVIANADALSGLVIAQLLEPGRPCVYNLGFAHVLDMASVIALTGAPENALLHVAGAELARYHKLPCAAWMSTEAPIADAQAAMEKMMLGLAHIAGGVNIIWGAGNLESTMSMSPEALVIDNEIVGAMKRYRRGITLDRESLALEAIREVGLAGDFISHEHTLRHYRQELSRMGIGNRARWGAWEERGGLSMEEQARARVEAILAQPPQPYVSPEQQRELARIERAGLAELGY